MNDKLQYMGDDVGAYDRVMETSRILTYKRHVQQVLQPLLRGSRVLELGCGSGYFTFDLIKWGAASVTGVDISPDMIALAQHKATADGISDVSFLVQDCMAEQRFSQDQDFDIVFAAWFMEHAGTREQMRGMMQCVSINLKPGGVFVCLTMPPSHDPAGYMELETRVRPMTDEKWVALLKSWSPVADGASASFIVHTDDPYHDLVMDQFLLKQDVIEGELRASGFTSVIWIQQSVPEEVYIYDDSEVSLKTGRPVAEWEAVKELPEYSILYALK